MGTLILHKLSIICLISATVPSSSALTAAVSAAQAVGLIHRDATCGGVSGLQQCGQSFPSDFCCPSTSKCLQLNNVVTTSVICCPAGQDCKFIQPITCDTSQLNATLHPENQIHAANLTGVTLPQCGSSCCPLGYTCSGGMCTLSSASSTSSSSTSPTASTANTALPASSQTSASTPPIPTASHSNPAFPAKAVVAGFFPGIILGVLLTLAVIWLINKRRESQRNRYSGDFGHVARTVSDPIYDPQYAARTDFLRRGSGSAASPSHSSPNSTTQMVARNNTLMRYNTNADVVQPPRVLSRFSRSPTVSSVPVPATARTRDPYATPTRTPTATTTNTTTRPSTRSTTRSTTRSATRPTRKSGPERSDSTETIDVLMPAPSFLQAPPMLAENGRPLTGATTFTTLMEHAGFSKEDREGVSRLGAGSSRRQVI